MIKKLLLMEMMKKPLNNVFNGYQIPNLKEKKLKIYKCKDQIIMLMLIINYIKLNLPDSKNLNNLCSLSNLNNNK